MQGLSEFLWLESLESIIDCSRLMVLPKTLLSDAIALMATHGKSVFVEFPEMSDSKFIDLVHPDDPEKFTSTYSWAIAIIGSFELKYGIFLEEQWSKYKWLVTRAIVRKDTTGKHAPLIGVSVDITSRVQAKPEQLRQSQQILYLIMDTIPQCVFWKDRNSVLLGCNRNFVKVLGFDQLSKSV